MEIKTRTYQKQDAFYLENIIRRTWHYDDFAGPKTAAKLARVFLSSCLANCTYSQVALYEQTPVGIILGKKADGFRCPLKRRLRQIKDIVSVLLTKEGRAAFRIFGGVNGVDEQLLKECGKDYAGELALFAVSPDYRGYGIGKKLFSSVLSYMKEEKVDDFYLFTDTTCNYGFYEHQGMTRRCEKSKEVALKGHTETIQFFIYDFAL